MKRLGCLLLLFLPGLLPSGSSAEDFSFERCLVTGSGTSAGPISPPRRGIDPSRYLHCQDAKRRFLDRQRAQEEAANQQRLKEEEAAARRSTLEARPPTLPPRRPADQEPKAPVDRARQDAEADAEVARDLERARRPAKTQQREAEVYLPGPCTQAIFTHDCAAPSDPVLDQIRRTREGAGGRSR